MLEDIYLKQIPIWTRMVNESFNEQKKEFKMMWNKMRNVKWDLFENKTKN